MTRYFGRYSCGGAIKSKSTTELRLGDNLSDANKQAITSSASYTIETVKQLAETVKSAASVIPVPGLSTVLTVAIKVLEACEEATVIEENVKGLHQRVCKLMLAVVHSTVSKETSQELQGRITSLQFVLESILADVDKIKQQKQWLLVFFHGLNKERVDKCVGRLNAALEDFQVVGQLRVEDLLDKINTLLEKIKADSSTTAAKLDRIEDTMNRISQPHNAPSAVLRQDMPPPHHIFCGRDGLVKDIASLLAITDKSRVCIAGVGGMGKTSVALAVIESVMKKGIFQKEYIFWIPCVEAKSSDLLRRILYAQLRIPAESYDSLDRLEEELKVNSRQRRLLLLDNFETPWLSNPGQDQANVRDILVRLAKLPHVALLVTMTSGFAPRVGIRWEHRQLLPLDPAAARMAFESKYREAASNSGRELAGPELDGFLNRPELDELLTSIGHIPLAITLAAANGGDLTTSLGDLLRDWKKAGTAMMPGEERLSMDETIRLSMERPVVKSNDDARTLLAILSMLPAGTTGANLGWWAPNLKSLPTAVRSLRTAALIEQGSGPFETSRIFLRPTIQSYMSHEGRISAEIREQVHDACYKFVLEHKSIPDDRKFKDDLKALGGEEINLQGLLMEIPIDAPRTDAIDALIAFGFYQAWTKPSTVVASRALDVARATHDGRLDATARRVAEAHHCLGRTFHRLDRYDEACPHFEEARRSFENLPGGADLHCAGECSMELSDTWMYMQKPKAEIALLVEKAMTNLSHDKTKRYYFARGLFRFGDFLWWSQNQVKALESLSAAKAIFEELDCPASAAECLFSMARTHASEGDYLKALPIARDALAKAQESGEARMICDILNCMATYLILLGSYEEASVIIPQLVTSWQALGSPLCIGQSLELLAYNCAAMMDLPGARAAYTMAQAQFAKIGSTQGREDTTRCSRNLTRLERIAEMDQNVFSGLEKPVPMY